MGSLKLENVDEKLDSLGVHCLQVMQQIVRCKLRLQDHIKDGSINLAKSRYIMGNHTVSATQLPTENSSPFKALCTVQHSDTVVDGIKSYTFSATRHNPVSKKTTPVKECESEFELKEIDTVDPLSSDPIYWFGVLVPQNLRQAQISFKSALELVVEIASLQSELEAMRIEFCTLKLDNMKLSEEEK